MKWWWVVFLPTVLSDINSIHAFNWFGFETSKMGLFCDQPHDYDWHFLKMTELGCNCIRLPFSGDYLRTDMKGMDDFFKTAENYNITIVLDYHRLNQYSQSPKPYDDSHPFSQFLDDWVLILDRYRWSTRLVAADLFNEWQSNDVDEWNSLALQTINHIEERFPNRFYYFVGCGSWGTDCQRVNIPVPFENTRIFYTIHAYTWTHQEPMEERWDVTFGNVNHRVVVGEYGVMMNKPDQVQWFDRFLRYLKNRGRRDSIFWCYNAGSSDTSGILLDDCSTVNYDLMNRLWDYWNS